MRPFFRSIALMAAPGLRVDGQYGVACRLKPSIHKKLLDAGLKAALN